MTPFAGFSKDSWVQHTKRDHELRVSVKCKWGAEEKCEAQSGSNGKE